MITYVVISYHDTLHSLQNSLRDGQLPFRLAVQLTVCNPEKNGDNVNHGESTEGWRSNRQTVSHQTDPSWGGWIREILRKLQNLLSVQLPEK